MTYSNVLFCPAVDLHRGGKKLEKKIIIKKTHTETFAKLESFLFLTFLIT